ncbi:MAG: dihydrofolate reductase family protein [Patescibacteria group bacterium]
MKVSIIAAVSADGFIARHTTEKANWTSKADKEYFKSFTKKIGTIIMGSTTFETIGKMLPGRRIIVLSRNKTYPGIRGVETSNETPRELLERLEHEGTREVVVCGGTTIYSEFMKEGLVDTVVLTVEPVVFGSGIKLFTLDTNIYFTLLRFTSLGDSAIILEYSVKK